MPDAFDIAVIERVIGFVHVDPETHPVGHLLPVFDIAHDRLATSSRKFLYADFFFNFFFVEYPQFLLDLVFNR